MAAFLKFIVFVYISQGLALTWTDKVPTFKKVSFEPALQHIFPNKKNIQGTGVNFSIEVERS